MNKKSLAFLLLTVILLLVSSCKKTPPRPPFLPPPESAAPPQTSLEVRTDYSHLKPYVPPLSMYPRLHEGPLPELIPSNGYGTLLPYANAVILDDGGLREMQYGFVTLGGMVVTDLVYDRIERAQSYHSYSQTPQPAYKLTRDIPGTETQWGWSQSELAACALDGSWVTAFDYTDIVFTEDVIVLMRSYESFDVDVYGYDGRLKYNIGACEWAGRLADNSWPGNLLYGISEGYGNILMSDGTYAYIDIATGQARYTEFTGAFPFSDGLASVAPMSSGHWESPELWGFIDKEFRLVIPARYVAPATFINGRALVETPGGLKQVINTRGLTMLTVQEGYIEQNYDGSGFAVHPESGVKAPTFYTIDLYEIVIPETAGNYGYMTNLYHLGDGWFYCQASNGAALFTMTKEYYIPGARHIAYCDGEYVIYRWIEDIDDGYGLILLEDAGTPKGRELILKEKNTTITAVTDNKAAKAFIVNTGPPMYSFAPGPYIHSEYRLVDTDGETIISGHGVLRYDEDAGLYSVLSDDHFTWLDLDANVIISIPLMSYALD